MQNIKFILYLFVCLLRLNFIRALLPAEDEFQNECSREILVTNAGNGSLFIPFEKNCSEYTYLINAKEKSSIIEIIVTSKNLNKDPQVFPDTTANVTINLQDDTNRKANYSNVSNKTWVVASGKIFKDTYYSRTPTMKVTVLSNGNFSEMRIKINFKEIAFETFYKNSSGDGSQGIKPWTSIEGRSYRPNSVYVFRILKPENLTTGNIRIVLHLLDLDEEMKEYLLIGAGLDPFEGPPPFFISQIYESKKYLVNDENAYIVFATGSTRHDHKGFYVTWKHTGKKIERKKEISNEDVHESVPICIYNMSAALEEFNKTEGWFQEFYKDLAELATKYAKENLSMHEEMNISSSSINIFRISGVIKVSESSQAFRARVKISKESDKGKAVFKRYELQRIMQMYTDQYSSNRANFLQIGNCPTKKMLYSWRKLSYYMIIPAICCALLLIWTWKQNPVLEYLAKKNRRKQASMLASSKFEEDDCSSKSTPQNPYTTLPQLQVTNDNRRRPTRNLSDALLDDGEPSEDELFNKMTPGAQNRRHSLNPQMSPGCHKHPEINQAFQLEEYHETQQQTEEKNEHMYDTVKSSTSMADTKL